MKYKARFKKLKHSVNFLLIYMNLTKIFQDYIALSHNPYSATEQV